MRIVWSPKWSAFFVLVAALVCASLIQTTSASFDRFQGRAKNHPESTVAIAHALQARATASKKGVTIEWRIGFEIDNLGFNIYRVTNGQRTQLNPSLIAGSALIARQQASPNSYSWFDQQGTLDSEYYVEAIDVRGAPTIHDTARPVWSASLPTRSQSELLEHLGESASAASAPDEWPETTKGSPSQTSVQAISTAAIADQWAIANQPALKIGVRSNGWYHITQPELAAAGFDTSGDAHNLRLFVNATDIAMRVSRDTGPLTSADYVEFWGQGLDTATTDTQIYWLLNSAQPGKRIAVAGELHTQADAARQSSASDNQNRAAMPLRVWFAGVSGAITGAAQPKEGDKPTKNTPPGNDENGSNVFSYDPGVNASRKDTPTNNATSRKVSEDPVIKPAEPVLMQPSSPSRSDDATARKRAKAGIGEASLQSPKRARRKHPRRGFARSSRRRNHAVLAAAAAPNFIYTVRRKDRLIFYPAALNGEQENFFGQVISGDPPPLTLTLRNIETTSAAPAQLTVALQGVSLENHQVNVFVNGVLAGSMTFLNEDSATQTFTIPISWLVEGDNGVKLLPVGSSHDTSVLDYVRITYPHSFRADSDSLQFSVKSTQSARIDGFTSANIRVLDTGDPTAVQEIRPIVENSGTGYALTIPPGQRGKARRLIALPNGQLSQPASLSLNQPSTLNLSTNVADLVIISYKEFIPALAPLVAQRQAQGFIVAVVNVEDVFDEFSYGVHTPQAIKDFMLLAKTTWARAPRYLLLVGDASYDPRNYGGFGNFDFVPSKQLDTGFPSTSTALETASDDWLVDFDNDAIADISVGRLPVRTATEANLVVSKIVNYLPANSPQSALLVADSQGSYYFNFEAADDQVGALLPASMAIQKVYRRLAPSDSAAKADIINKFNAGQALAIYSGHGNVDIWGGSIFTSTDALALTNGNRLPFVVVMDCLNGYFASPSLQSLAESLLKAPNGGAVASFASSGLTIPDGQHEMGQRMFQLLYGGSSIPIGDASRQAKYATSDLDVRRTWILFGDPTMKIR